MPHLVVLEEFPSPAGVALWQAAQDATLFATVPPEQRGPGLFADAAAESGDVLPAEIRPEILELGALVRDTRPESAGTVAEMCRRVSSWAERGGHTGTALEFAQAAALADRGHPEHAFEVARLARLRGDVARAAVWFRRAVVLARRAGDWQTYTHSFLELSRLVEELGDAPRARVLRERALRLAFRHSLRGLRGEAALETARAQYGSADGTGTVRLLRTAVRAYAAEPAAVPDLAREVAGCLVDRLGVFGPALPVLRELVARASGAGELLPLLGRIARAAAGAGDRALFEAAWMEIRLHPEHEAAPGVLLEVARAAGSLGDGERAAAAAREALRLAEEQGDAEAAVRGRALLGELEGADPSGAELPAAGAQAPDPAEVEGLVREVLVALRRVPRSEDSYVQALTAALAAPGDPQAAYEMGRRARCAAEYTRAEEWYRRAMALGREAGEWDVCVWSMGGIANVHRQRGNLPLAVSFQEKARMIARGHGLRDLEGDMLFGVAALYFEMENGAVGFEWARRALLVYGPRNPRISRVAHDVAVYFINQGDYRNALTVLQEIAHAPWPVADALLRKANTALAAAGAGDLQRFEQAWRDAQGTIRQMRPDQENHAMALVSLAHAAMLAGRMEWASAAAQRGLGLARERKETHAVFLAEETQRKIVQVKRTRTPPSVGPAPTHDQAGATALAEDIVSVLRVGTTSRRKMVPPSRRSLEE